MVRSVNEPGQYQHEGLAPGSVNEPLSVPADVYAPTITSLSPSSAPAGGPNITVYLTGTGFFAKSVVFVNGGVRVTKLEPDGRLSTVMRPSIWAPVTIRFQVRNGSYTSNTMEFMFTPAEGG